MAFINTALDGLKVVVTALGGGLGVWGVINLLEGYGGDNPAFYVADESEESGYKLATSYDGSATYYTKTEGTAGTSKYDSKSNTLTTTSRSSADVKLTVQVAAASDGNVTLVDSAPSTSGYTAVDVDDEDAFKSGTFYTESSGTYTKATTYSNSAEYYKESDAELYLALMVGSDATPIKAGETVSKEVTIAGVDGNFETKYDSTDAAYKYTVKDTLESPWNTADFYLTGVASKANAENVTVPTLTVTWKYEDSDSSSGGDSESAATEAFMTFTQAASGTYYVVIEKEENTGFGGDFVIGDIDSLKINGVDVLSSAFVSQDKYISIKWSDVRTALDISSLTDVESLVATFSIDDVDYTATYVTE